jgi:hypothetical protein
MILSLVFASTPALLHLATEPATKAARVSTAVTFDLATELASSRLIRTLQRFKGQLTPLAFNSSNALPSCGCSSMF